MVDAGATPAPKKRVPNRTNYVLVDYENVQPKSLAALMSDIPFKVFLFVGASQRNVSVEILQSMMALGPNGEIVRISGNGTNALDFHIAFHMGRLATADAHAFFHVISKDTGFDPLITHMKEKGIYACRSRDIAQMPILKRATEKIADKKPKPAANKLDLIMTDLRRRGSAKPRRLKTLSGTISSLFQGKLPEKELTDLLSALKDAGHVVVDGTKVSYRL